MKNNLLIIVVVLLVVVGGIILFSSKPSSQQEVKNQNSLMEEFTTTTNETIATTTEGVGTISSDQFNLRGSYKCTYKIEEGLSATTYVKNGKMRTEVPLESSNITVVLYSGDKVYQWSDKEKQGVVISIADAQQQVGTTVEDPETYLKDIKNKYHADCQNMNLSDSLFSVPNDIQFQDLAEALRQ